MAEAANGYDSSSIKTLSPLMHIRHRPGMYTGRLGDGSHPDDGIYVLVKEIIDNCIDEFTMGVGKRIDITLERRQRDCARLRPRHSARQGRGLRLRNEHRRQVRGRCVRLFDRLNGVGTKAVNALSEKFTVRSTRDGRFHEARFERGVLQGEEEGETAERNGTYVAFTPDGELFPGTRSSRNIWRSGSGCMRI